jgi:hypothetical protein
MQAARHFIRYRRATEPRNSTSWRRRPGLSHFADKRCKLRFGKTSNIKSHEGPMTQEEQVKLNYDAFKKLLPSLLKDVSKYALMRDGEVVAIYDTMPDAVTTAQKLFPDGRWSIQRITDKPINLGYRSRAVLGG